MHLLPAYAPRETGPGFLLVWERFGIRVTTNDPPFWRWPQIHVKREPLCVMVGWRLSSVTVALL